MKTQEFTKELHYAQNRFKKFCNENFKHWQQDTNLEEDDLQYDPSEVMDFILSKCSDLVTKEITVEEIYNHIIKGFPKRILD